MIETSTPFDYLMKRLSQDNPQALVNWFLPGAVLMKEFPRELKLTEFDVDMLLMIMWEGEEMLLHIEFQTNNDYKMAHRTLRYNVLARIEHSHPVLSIVIYLFQDGNVPASPLCWSVPSGQRILEFHFINVKLWELTAENLMSLDAVELLTLIPFTKNGANLEAVTQMIADLEKAENTDLLYIGYNLASLALKRRNASDLDWLIRRFAEMQEQLEDSPIYQLTLDIGMEKGIQKGLEQGLEKGRIEEARTLLLTIVEAKYAHTDLPQLARALTEQISDRAILQRLVTQISIASTFEEAHTALLQVNKKSKSK